MHPRKSRNRRYPSIGDVITDLRHVMVDPDYDIYGSGLETDEENDPSITRPISREELAQIQGRRRSRVEEAAVQEVEPEEDETEEPEDFSDEDEYEEKSQPEQPTHKKRTVKKKEKDVSTQFERIIMVMGIVAAILVAVVVIFVFSRLTGLFCPRQIRTRKQKWSPAKNQQKVSMFPWQMTRLICQMSWDFQRIWQKQN